MPVITENIKLLKASHKKICKRHADVVNISDYLNVPHIRLATALLHHTVDKNVMELFPLALEFVEEIYELLGSVISFHVYAKLLCGIKMQILLDVLQRGQTVTALAKLNEYFPRMGIRNSIATSKELSRLNKHISNFRKFFLPLLANKKQRNYYFTNEYEEEYGEGYLCGLQRSAYKFVNRVDEQLPKPKIQKILERGAQYFNGFSSSEVAYEILLDYCVNQTSLSCEDMLDILTSISPLYTQDIVYTEHNDTSLSSSIYEKENDYIFSNSSDILILSNTSLSISESKENSTTGGKSFTQLKDLNGKCSPVNNDSDIGGLKRKADENVPASGSKRKQYRFKKGKHKVHHSREHVVNHSENVAELVEMPFRYNSRENGDHDLYSNNSLQTSTSFTECDLLVRTSLEMVEKEAIEEGLLSKDDITNSSDKTDDDSVTNVDDIPITSDEDNLVIQSSICPESSVCSEVSIITDINDIPKTSNEDNLVIQSTICPEVSIITDINDIPKTSNEDNLVIQSSIWSENTDSEDILLDVSKSIKDQRKYCGLNPEIKLVYDITLSDNEDAAYKIFT
ncbi:hypothetical protein LOTGIDRAFT_160715 [Lottia gigantea]|uniref:TERF1-interacting nuclear factor 2 N-terminal domain-containing protein n=1 Tax=Lottia gigantea TaxID=225164 RepID=V4ADN6_LOTGI|nr:hypothetical protein LOTGIDRAFT_160715 [Lottia gigantea]ESO94962.1 hypothetical protein LOTGIDRAFT_160715 [Lottia gigantea]